MNKIYEQAGLLQEELVAIRRELHRNVEVGTKLPNTKALVRRKLTEYGYAPEDIAESSVTAAISGDLPGRTLLLRADMDGLAIREETSLPFQSVNGAMHACGHDMHTTMLLGAAKLLRMYRNQIHGTVKLLFQEDEEGFTGAKAVIRAGVLENPKVDAAMGIHVNSGTPSGMILGGLGHFMAGCTLFRIEVNGVCSHGAMPEKGIDPINIAAHIYLSLQSVVAREVAAQDPCVLTIGKFSGGQAPNIIPEKVVMEGTIRYKERETGTRVFERIRQISNLCARSFGGNAVVTEIASAPPLINNEDMLYAFSDAVKQFDGVKPFVILPQGGMGSEDFASFSYEVPSAYLLLGAGSPQENEAYGKPMHNPAVVFNEDILSLGSAVYAACAIHWLKNPKF